MRVLRLSGMPILQQLRLEEALLRTDAGNWFLLNDGTPEPAVVMGISGCAQQGPARCPLSLGRYAYARNSVNHGSKCCTKAT